MVIVSESDPWLPTFTLPKLKLVGFALNAPGDVETPVPDSGIVMLEFEASDLMIADPAALPLALGEKVIVKVVVAEAASVNGVAIPLEEKPVPATVT